MCFVAPASRLFENAQVSPGPESAPSVSRQPPRLRSRIALVATAVVVALLVGEIALRILGLPRPNDDFRFLSLGVEDDSYEPDPTTFWRLSPSAEQYQPNRHGLRGFWPNPGPRPNLLRIACVGDSSTFGVGMRYEDTYGMLLEQRLQDALPSRYVETVLAGLPGFSTYQSIELYRHRVAELRPHVTVIYVGAWNDFSGAVEVPDAERRSTDERFESSLLARSRIARMIRNASRNARTEAALEQSRARQDDVPRRVPLADFRANVATLFAAARDAGSRVIAIVPPVSDIGLLTRPLALDYRAALVDVAREHEVALIDGPRLFEEKDQELPKALYRSAAWATPCYLDYVHPTTLGHRVLAERIAELVLEDVPPPVGDAEPPAAAEITSVPARYDPASEGELIVRGRGFATPGLLQRVWFGNLWVPDYEVVDDTSLRLELHTIVPPGPRRVVLRTVAGAVRSEPVDVPARVLRAEVAPGSPAVYTLTIDDCPRGTIWVWFSTELATVPRETPFGRFELLGGLPPAPHAPVRFHELTLQGFWTNVESAGPWSFRRRYPRVPAVDTWVQALVIDPRQPYYGALTAVSKIEVIE